MAHTAPSLLLPTPKVQCWGRVGQSWGSRGCPLGHFYRCDAHFWWEWLMEGCWKHSTAPEGGSGSFINTSANDLCDWQFRQFRGVYLSSAGWGQGRTGPQGPGRCHQCHLPKPRRMIRPHSVVLSTRKENSAEKAGECHWLHSTSVPSQDNLF